MVGTTAISGNAVVTSGTNAVGTTGGITGALATATIGSIFSGGTAPSTFSGGTGGNSGSTFSSGTGSTFSGGTGGIGTSGGTTVRASNSTVGTLPTDRGLEHTTAMFDTYWELLDAVDKYTAMHDSLLKKRRSLTTCIKQIKQSYQGNGLPNLSLALSEPFTELEAVNQQLQNFVLDYDKKVELLKKLPSVMASEGVLAVRSLRDIRMVNNLQIICRWKGEVKLVLGGRDPIEECLNLIGKYNIRMTNN